MPVAPPRPKGPPLNALRAFEAAARLGGFALAAEELSVSPGAISQHVRTLEAWAGTALFERHAQGVRLTGTGARLLPRFSEAFDLMGLATRELRDAAPAPNLLVAALPGIAQLWLPGRMARLRALMPDATLSVTAMESPPNLKREIFDLTLFLQDPAEAPGAQVLEDDEIYPVCTPQIAARLTGPADLARETLLLDASWPDDWDRWCDGAGIARFDTSGALRHSLYALAVEEARNGAGVLMGHACLVRPAQREGALVAPFGPGVRTGKALVLSAVGKARGLARTLAAMAD